MAALCASLGASGVLAPAAAAQAPARAPILAPRALPLPSGSHAVGRRAFELVDSTRRDPADSAHPRVITGWIWYPAARPAGSPAPERALPGEWNDLRAAMSAAKIGDAAAEAMRVVTVRAVTDAPWAPDVPHAPVLVFVPGNGWLATDYSVLLEDLASHGYVVIGLAPVGLADVVRLRDGRTLRKALGVGAAIGEDQVHAHRDVMHLLARLAELDATRDAPWCGHLDLARIGMLGHSLGGTTALVAAASDTAVRAAINLDGDAMGGVVDVRPRQPLLFVSHELPTMAEAPPARDSAWAELTRQGLERSERRRSDEWSRISSRSASATRLRVLGMRHLNFTDAALVSGLVDGPQQRWMRWGPIDGARGLRIVADVVRAFLDHALLDRPAPGVLVRPDTAYPELRIVGGG